MQNKMHKMELNTLKMSLSKQESPPQAISDINKSSKEATQATEQRTNTSAQEDLIQYRDNEIQKTIIKNAVEMQKCYNKLLQTDKSQTSGLVNIGWTIGGNGKVTSSEILSSNFTDIDFKTCIIDIVNRYDFKETPQQKSYYFSHEYNFEAKKTVNHENK